MDRFTDGAVSIFEDGLDLIDLLFSSITGDRLAALLIYVVMASCRLLNPLNIIIAGSSSSGKSFLMKEIAKLFPEEWFISVSMLSPMALTKMGENELSHKIFMIGELLGASDPKAAFTIRMIQSEQVFHHTVATGPNTKEDRTIKGPIATVLTTSEDLDSIPEDNRNRSLIIETDQTPEQTEEILYAQATRAASLVVQSGRLEEARTNHQIALLGLKSYRVIIPFAHYIIPKRRSITTRRDFPKVLIILETIAYLRQRTKEVHVENGVHYITADLRDYELAFPLLNFAFKITVNAVSALREHYDRIKAASDPSKAFTRREVEKWLGLGSTKTKLVLRDLCEHGFLTIVHAAKSNKPASYALGTEIPSGTDLFIKPEDLAVKCAQRDRDRTAYRNDSGFSADAAVGGLQ